MAPRGKQILCVLAWLAGIGLCTWHYLDDGIRKMWPTNTRENHDQVFYMHQAEETVLLGKPRHLQRSRMPLYPRLLSFFYPRGASTEEIFARFKTANVFMSLAVLLGMLAVARWTLGTALAVPLTLAAAFTFIVFKAVLVQPEVIFYLLYFLAFVLMASNLRRPDWRLALAIGVLVGVTHLTKGSSLPMLAAFLAVSTLAALLEWRRRNAPSLTGGWRWMPPACLAGFLIVTTQFFWTSYRVFGNPLYDPNTQIYFWAESPDELAALQDLKLAHRRPTLDAEVMGSPLVQRFFPLWAPDPVLREEIKARVAAGEHLRLIGRFDILPGAKKYFREHSLAEAGARLTSGIAHVVMRNLRHRNGYGRHLAVWAGLALGVGGLAVIFCGPACARELSASRYAIAFVVLNLAGNLMLYGWWAHVSNRNRFFLTQFAPFLCACGWVLRFGARVLPWRWAVKMPTRWGGRSFTLTPWHAVVAALWLFAVQDVWDLDAGPKQLPQ